MKYYLIYCLFLTLSPNINVIISSFETFCVFLNVKNRHFGQNLVSNFLLFPGGIKIEVIAKLIVEPKFHNMNFKTHKNKAQLKRSALYLKK